MNMLFSLKALLSSSALPGIAAVAAKGQDDSTGFAAMLDGSMAAPLPGEAAATLAGETVDAEPAVPVVPEFRADMDPPGERGAHDHVPPGLAVAVAAGKGTPDTLPPGLALGLIKHDAALQPAPQNEAEPESGTVDVAPLPLAVPPQVAVPEELAEAKVKPKSSQVHHHQDADLGDPADLTQAEAEAGVAADSEAEDTASAELPMAYAPDAVPVMTPSVPVPTAPVVTEASASKGDKAVKPAKTIAPAPVAVEGQRHEVVPPSTQPQDVAPTVRSDNAPAPVPVADNGALPTPHKPIAIKQVGGPASKQDQPATEAADPVAETPQPTAPVLNGQPVKSEALALLQLVREQVSARQSGASVRVGEQVSAAASAKEKPATAKADVPPVSFVAAQPLDAAPVPSSATASPMAVQPVISSAPVVDLSASLGAQMVDMGVSGQWIDGLARDIAGLSANGAQGRFQIDTHHLGAVQVDIRQGAEGAAVSLTVASEAAEAALRQDSDRLKLDAGLAAVRISEVRVERAAPVAEAQRADMGGQSSSQQQSQSQQQGSQTASAWQQNNGQNMGQPQGQQSRWQGRENNGLGPKSSSDPAVLNHADTRSSAHDGVRARYA
ncbi:MULTISPECIES: flagellar hook-length control protein FliK [Sphingobium]|uniref:flagellar hook-length control protein FliK n=1 Tax=Sphingobium sp. MI1205 TaxID=407020 RepID=UPI00076FF2EC|nr:flagellar hook-length control protein FliK [Sphingobium sp. MI1205]AMK18999.1 hypothetical protein K663_13095 [Sphingobium sp. MI1205]